MFSFIGACSRWTWIGLLSVTVFAWLPGTLRAHDLSYHYVAIDPLVPANLWWFHATTMAEDGRVYGTSCYNPDCPTEYIAYFEDGAVTLTSFEGSPTAISSHGLIGGIVLVDSVNGIQSAVIYRNGKQEIIPPQPNETFAAVRSLNDRGEALIESWDAQDNVTYFLYSRGRTTPLSFGPDVVSPQFKSWRVLNDRGVLAGVQGEDEFADGRAFRHDIHRRQTTLLPPRSTDLLSWAMGINKRGDVLGYSFSPETPESAYVERVGIWDKRGRFKTYYVSDKSSESLMFNDDRLIVVSGIKDSDDSYVVPEPGKKINVTEVVRDLPPNTTLDYIFDMNNRGDMLGGGNAGTFLLQRCGRH